MSTGRGTHGRMHLLRLHSMSEQLPREQLRRLGQAHLDGEDMADAIDEIVRCAGYRWRIREADSTLVCVPGTWFNDGVVMPERVDTAEAIEIECAPSATGYDAVATANAEVAAAVSAAYGPTHGENAAIIARFMSAHMRRPIASMTEADRAAFDEFYRRNAWPSDDAKEVITQSVKLMRELAATDGH